MSEVERTGARLALFACGLTVALLAGFGVGRAAGPDAAQDQTQTKDQNHGGTGNDGHSHASGDAGDVAGTTMSAGGYTLVPETTTFQAGVAQPLAFRMTGPDGAAVTRYEVAHDRQLHLIVARRDLTDYQHLHPALDPAGRWTVPLTLPTPGSYRAYADFVTVDAGGRLVEATLAVDLTVAGDHRPARLPAVAREDAVDGFTVAIDGALRVGATQPLLLRVTGGAAPPVLERYLGAYGHLVVLRDGDLAYLHVHPEDRLAGGAVKFWLAAPSPGRYRAFFDFQVAGTVRTASFTLDVP